MLRTVKSLLALPLLAALLILLGAHTAPAQKDRPFPIPLGGYHLRAPLSWHPLYPQDNAVVEDANVTLAWAAVTDLPSEYLAYDVYFGEDPNPPLVSEAQQENSYLVGLLSPGHYFWQVAAKGPGGESISPLWTFEVLPWVRGAVSNTHLRWLVLRPGSYVVEFCSLYVSSNCDVILHIEEESAEFKTSYSIGPSPWESETGWVPGDDLSGFTYLIRGPGSSSEAYKGKDHRVVRLWLMMTVDDASAADYDQRVSIRIAPVPPEG